MSDASYNGFLSTVRHGIAAMSAGGSKMQGSARRLLTPTGNITAESDTFEAFRTGSGEFHCYYSLIAAVVDWFVLR